MSTLLELAERVEAATGPDRELDAEISTAVDDGCNIRWHDLRLFAFATGRSPPLYTASLDAAMSLVPQGMDWAVDCTMGGVSAAVGFWPDSPSCSGATPALALTAAAIRALASESQQ